MAVVLLCERGATADEIGRFTRSSNDGKEIETAQSRTRRQASKLVVTLAGGRLPAGPVSVNEPGGESCPPPSHVPGCAGSSDIGGWTHS
mmetsp:Transcript_81296/g.218639  ORF Transcript_81296/g.218639 Transcript_81296/m.218639 type:complete len:89 (+) Transcript_81296:155-421(+)